MMLQPGTSPVAHLAAYPVLNSHLQDTIGASVCASDGATMETEGGEEARTELDSHANMFCKTDRANESLCARPNLVCVRLSTRFSNSVESNIL